MSGFISGLSVLFHWFICFFGTSVTLVDYYSFVVLLRKPQKPWQRKETNSTRRYGKARFIQHRCGLRGVTSRVWAPGLCSQKLLYSTGSYFSHVSSPKLLPSRSRGCSCLKNWASKVTEAKLINNAWSNIGRSYWLRHRGCGCYIITRRMVWGEEGEVMSLS